MLFLFYSIEMLNYWKIFTTIFENMVSSSNHCFLSFGITGLILNKRMTFYFLWF